MLFITGFGEIFEKPDNEEIEFGDVVCIGLDGLVHKVKTEEDINRVIGVCSDTIGFELAGGTLDLPKNRKVEVEMCGKIWTKTNDSAIAPGDIVKVLSDGTVMKTDDKNVKFGVAMTNNINGKVRIVYNG